MEPYTAEGMAWREARTASSSSTDLTEGSTLSRQPSVVIDAAPPGSVGPTTPTKTSSENLNEVFPPVADTESVKSLPLPASPAVGNGLCVSATSSAAVGVNHINYELVGIVVHSGQANAGHYYSFIKDRRLVIAKRGIVAFLYLLEIDRRANKVKL